MNLDSYGDRLILPIYNLSNHFLRLNMTANNPPKGSGPVLEWWDFVSTILYR
jgi:hypothetical protein